MKELLNKFENKVPEIVFQWQDAETEAKGWVVINSLRGGAAGGGTRMRVGLDQHEVTSLAKPWKLNLLSLDHQLVERNLELTLIQMTQEKKEY